MQKEVSSIKPMLERAQMRFSLPQNKIITIMANFVLCKIAAQLQFCLPKLQWPNTGSKPIYEGLILCGRPYPQTSLAAVCLPQHKTLTSPPSKACYCQPQTLCIFDVEIKYILTNYKRQGITFPLELMKIHGK